MLYVFVEGPDDEKYFSEIYGVLLDGPKFIQYSGWTNQKVNNFIYSIGCIPESNYIFTGDADGKSIEEKQKKLLHQYNNLNASKVFVVQYEIESWYYAGVEAKLCEELKLKKYIYCTDEISKEDFNAKLPKQTDRKFIMTKMLEMYNLNIAINRNRSLAQFDAGI